MEKGNKGRLYIVATPIGNLKDITLRALEVLREVDIIACEDTRRTRILLNHYEITKPLISYYKHKEHERTTKILNFLEDGKNIALVSDAGMPCISDPGAILVQSVRKEDYEITVIPGASALDTAIALSGIDDNFTFLGFLSSQKKKRETIINKFKSAPTALVIFSSPHNLIANLEFLYENLGERKVHIIKELTKIYENIQSGILGEIEPLTPKGEYIIIIERGKDNDSTAVTNEDIKQNIQQLLDAGFTKKEAIQKVCNTYDISKNKVYALALEL